jgi:pimeloyl-ACP methyl ester carboxylesterase
MKLYFREYGEGEQNIIILHGLFGSSKNWITNAKEISKFAKVYSIDLRNHGDSPHADTHTIQNLIDDLKEFIEDHKIHYPLLLGHSMGGLTSLYFSLEYPELISALIVVDIAPKNYELNYSKEFACFHLDVSQMESRQEIDQAMATIYSDQFIRQFLQMNLEKKEIGYTWKLNYQVLESSRKALYYNLDKDLKFLKPSLFILGEISEYIEKTDYEEIKFFFPNTKIDVIKGAGHYLHYTHQKEFLESIKKFISSI